ncbi:MAG: DUF4956 domain-containing protein [Sedimentisphaerales bacterium]|nr:DUF4956 domain-containing protein [Sedimentisphaerales bacterium]
MDRILEILDASSYTGATFDFQTSLLSLLLAFVLGQALAWVYYFTHSGLSYSKSFVQSLIIITVVISMVMSTIAGSFVTAVGLMGALSIIRFRNMIKDTRDIAFIFCALVIGMATGSQRFEIAILGTVVICSVLLYLHISDFGTHMPHNGFLRFNLTEHIGPDHPLPGILKRFCKNFTLISAQDSDFGGQVVEYAYQVMIRNAARNEQMLSELQKLEGVSNLSLTMQEQLLEV